MPDRESVGGPGTTGSGGFLPLQFPSAFAAFHASTAPGGPASAMHHATHYHHHAQHQSSDSNSLDLRLARNQYLRADSGPHPSLRGIAPLHARPPEGYPLPRELLESDSSSDREDEL